MTGFEADLAALTAGATDFDAFAERAGKVFGDLDGALGSLGACWGDDAIGRSFASSHVRPAADALTGLGDLGPAFGGVGRRFADTARTYRRVDEGNSTALDAV
ncbi:WXG100 family type VII secretion target [Saccharothrix algeriensis]|uniref:WXG100 family type VII secretion target n=1 Tax=Saccharothrix algeriensis TaxID=173560 RepID=A0A8T8HUL3_9PSEU|nr:hypothetical protein [Saccharothrix algeriensis]MBM7812923.1 hypothetical protein [Saccharothrix algeriensis]QTR01564.1 hypothetical protein J7S33_19600 [Saccharothrix algeriensis]